MMTAHEFEEAVKNDDLSDSAIKKKWDNLCDALKNHDVECIVMMINEGILSGIVAVESMDGFGTEGMSL